MSDAGLTLSLEPETLETLVERVAELLLERTDGQRQTSPYWTVNEAADYLRCSRQRIYDLLSSGRLRRYKDGSRVLIRREELDAYVAGVTPLPPVAPALPLTSKSACEGGLWRERATRDSLVKVADSRPRS